MLLGRANNFYTIRESETKLVDYNLISLIKWIELMWIYIALYTHALTRPDPNPTRNI